MEKNQETSILIVDDEEAIHKLLATYLSNDHACVTANNADEATRLLSAGSFNLVLTDITMPGASGLELCQYIQKACPDTVVIVVSGMTDIQYAVEAMRQGAFDYLIKPFDLAQVNMAIDRALRYQALIAAKRHYEQSLEETVMARTRELRALNENLNQTLEALYTNYRATLRALAGALEARDVETSGHSDRVVAYCLRLGRELGISHNDLIGLEQGALLHDIGKIGVPDSILLKCGPLTDEEWREMRRHIEHGLSIIDGIDFLSGARPVVGQHHEKYNGSGYPRGLRGEAIHINARIFAVADAYDAITSDRPYRAAQAYVQARDEIVANAGSHFDPKVVKAFLKVPESEWAEIRRTAESKDYIEQIIEKRELRSFIVSLKRHSGTTGPLSLAVA
ncbi:MAG: response regulator [Blastocatellia bacterium]|nr:response regulator [Blastocatellia bacterium]